jgi:hypothetical protein
MYATAACQSIKLIMTLMTIGLTIRVNTATRSRCKHSEAP